MLYDICCVGHITHDRVVTPGSVMEMPGGTAWYFSHAMAALGSRGYVVATSLGQTDMAAVETLRSLGVEVRAAVGRATVCFENIYGRDTNRRTQHVTAKADPICTGDVEGIEASVWHLGSLLADDFADGLLKSLAGRGDVSVDAQGFLRRVEGTEVLPCDWGSKRELLPFIHWLKANEHEMEALTGSEDPFDAAAILSDWGVGEVVLTLGDRGSVIRREGTVVVVPAYSPRIAADATGCGDTYMAGYLHGRLHGKSIEEAGHIAAAMCTLKIEKPGPFSGTPADIAEVIGSRPEISLRP